jgi:hypothetical protein
MAIAEPTKPAPRTTMFFIQYSFAISYKINFTPGYKKRGSKAPSLSCLG